MGALVFGDALESPAERRRFVALYEAAFPLTERDPTPQLLEDLEARRRALLVARSDGVLVGLLVHALVRGGSLAFIEYLAVDEARRGQGVGGALLDEFRRRLALGGPPVGGALLEIDPLDEASGDELRRRARRQRFFEQAGAMAVEGLPRLEVPNLAAPGTLRLTLMWLPTAPHLPAPAGAALREAVTALLVEGYGLAVTDPLVRRNTDAIPG